jgi:hypothetical protein
VHLTGFSRDSNTVEWATRIHWSTLVFRRLLNNPQFREGFINRFADQLNTAFRPERVIGIIDSIAALIEPEMTEHIERWSSPPSLTAWQGNVKIMRNYAQARPAYMREHLRSFFDIEKLVELTVDASDPSTGRIFVNTIELSPATPGVDPRPFPWKGIYFHNVPVTLRAKPLPGFVFSHWEGLQPGDLADSINAALTDPEITLSLTDSIAVTAVFAVDDGAEPIPLPFSLKEHQYSFSIWPPNAAAGTYPQNMAFVYMHAPDPGHDAQIGGFTSGVYNLDSRTRINGHGSGWLCIYQYEQ